MEGLGLGVQGVGFRGLWLKCMGYGLFGMVSSLWFTVDGRWFRVRL